VRPYWFFVEETNSIREHLLRLPTAARIYAKTYRNLTTLLPVYLLSSPTVVLQFAEIYTDERAKSPEWYVESRFAQFRERDEDVDDPDLGSVSMRFGPSRTLRDFTKLAAPLLRSGSIVLLPTVKLDVFSGFRREASAATFYNGCQSLDVVPLRTNEDLMKLLETILVPVLAGIPLDTTLRLVTDEWDSYKRCQERFVEAYHELEHAKETGDLVAAAKRVKRELVDEGVDLVARRYKELKRKGLFEAIGGYIVSAAVYFSSLKSGDAKDQLITALGAAGSVLHAIHTLVDVREERRELEESSFYFVLRLTGRA